MAAAAAAADPTQPSCYACMRVTARLVSALLILGLVVSGITIIAQNYDIIDEPSCGLALATMGLQVIAFCIVAFVPMRMFRDCGVWCILVTLVVIMFIVSTVLFSRMPFFLTLPSNHYPRQDTDFQRWVLAEFLVTVITTGCAVVYGCYLWLCGDW